jgi:hypothetical protein
MLFISTSYDFWHTHCFFSKSKKIMTKKLYKEKTIEFTTLTEGDSTIKQSPK